MYSSSSGIKIDGSGIDGAIDVGVIRQDVAGNGGDLVGGDVVAQARAERRALPGDRRSPDFDVAALQPGADPDGHEENERALLVQELAERLARSLLDGLAFVVERPPAGGHSAPPRGKGSYFPSINPATGETVWCSEEVDRFAAISSPLIDREGNLYLADGSAMHAFRRDGTVLWETPIQGVPVFQ